MRPSEDMSDDERGLLDEKWSARREDGSCKIWIASTICLLFGFALGLLSNRIPTPKTMRAHADGYLTKAPFEPSVKVTFQQNETFEHVPPGPDADALWQTLQPLGRGLVQVKTDGDVWETRNVAAFHQIHCLNMLRKSLYDSVVSGPNFQQQLPQLERHLRHCFDYLRQALTCNADITLEKLQLSEGRLGAVDGWGTEHMCRDWEGLKQWAERHRGINDDERG